MKKTFKTVLLAGSLAAALLLSACGSTASSAVSAAATGSSEASSSAPATSATGEKTVLLVGASPAPHAEILEFIKPTLAEQGIDLQIKEFSDYILPNTALFNGELDANYFQHNAYLEDFNVKNSMDLVNAASVHFEPLGLYPGKTATLEELADGAQIGVPNDPTNEARALFLLQDQGLITLKEGVGFEAVPADIVENPHNIKFVELEAAQLPATLPDLDFAVINGNYAVGSGIESTVLLTEDKDSTAAQTYPNVLAVQNGDETRPEIQALVDALLSDEVADFINEKYQGVVIPVF